jgi:two-component system, LytTR family, response regulator
MIRALIVDDASQVRKLLRLMLSELAVDVQLIGEAENLQQAVELIRLEKPQLVFLDIEMPGKNGLQLVSELTAEELNFHIIFITAYSQYAIQAFRLSAVDYLIKPVKEKELLEALGKVRKQTELNRLSQQLKNLSEHLKLEANNTICIPVNYGQEYIHVNDIEYIEADNTYVYIYFVNGERKLVTKHLKYFEDLLCDFELFAKVHRSFIINRKQLKAFRKEDRGMIVMNSGKQISLSRTHRQSFLELLDST